MGMSVKGLREHQMIRHALTAMADVLRRRLTDDEQAAADRLVKRADLAIDRIKRRKDGRPRGAQAIA